MNECYEIFLKDLSRDPLPERSSVNKKIQKTGAQKFRKLSEKEQRRYLTSLIITLVSDMTWIQERESLMDIEIQNAKEAIHFSHFAVQRLSELKQEAKDLDKDQSRYLEAIRILSTYLLVISVLEKELIGGSLISIIMEYLS